MHWHSLVRTSWHATAHNGIHCMRADGCCLRVFGTCQISSAHKLHTIANILPDTQWHSLLGTQWHALAFNVTYNGTYCMRANIPHGTHQHVLAHTGMYNMTRNCTHWHSRACIVWLCDTQLHTLALNGMHYMTCSGKYNCTQGETPLQLV